MKTKDYNSLGTGIYSLLHSNEAQASSIPIKSSESEDQSASYSRSPPLIVDSSKCEKEYIKENYDVEGNLSKGGWCEESLIKSGTKPVNAKPTNSVNIEHFDELSCMFSNVLQERDELREKVSKQQNRIKQIEGKRAKIRTCTTSRINMTQEDGQKKDSVTNRRKSNLGAYSRNRNYKLVKRISL